MAIKKSDIYRSLWDSCDQLRGGMDASLYKDYILTLWFVKYVSDRAGRSDALIEVPQGCSFEDLRKLRGKKDIGEGIDKAIAGIADRIQLLVPSDSSYEDRKRWMENWHRAELRNAASPRVEKWASRLGVKASNWGIRRMKTKWGSCNPEKGTIWLNLELARKDIAALDYVILHETAHFLSPRHDETFLAILDRHLPTWRQVKADLNAAPLSD